MTVFERIKEDIRTAFREDPAARTIWEVLLCYPGLHVIWFHGVANWFWRNNLKTFARILSHISRFLTQIEIHPGAEIGRRFFIDHGAGIVIGETTKIGQDVLIYQGVVLGGTSQEKTKRHPTIEDRVVIGAGAILLGPIVVGQGSRIGAGSVVIKDVPQGATVVGVPGRIVETKGPKKVSGIDLDHNKLPDPVIQVLDRLEKRIKNLENKLEQKG